MPLIPVTATRVSELRAAASWSAAELQTRQAARRNAFRRTSCLTGRVYAAAPRRTQARRRATGGGRTARRGLGCKPPDGDDAAATRELVEERPCGADLRACRPPVRRRRPRMGRHDVPEQNVVLYSELTQDAVHDRRGRLGGSAAGQLSLRGERNAADPRAAVAGRLADEHETRVRTLLEMRAQPRAAQLGASVLVVRRSDACARESLYDLYGRKAKSSGTIEVGVSKNGPAPSGSMVVAPSLAKNVAICCCAAKRERRSGRAGHVRQERVRVLRRPPGWRRMRGRCGRASSATAGRPARMIALVVGFGTVMSPRANWRITGSRDERRVRGRVRRLLRPLGVVDQRPGSPRRRERCRPRSAGSAAGCSR